MGADSLRSLGYASQGGELMRRERIEINSDAMGGKPVIRGTRIPVDSILRKLGAGVSPDAILADYPRLGPEDVRAALAFAATD